MGLNYRHGTGHGIGSYGFIHESPVQVSINRKQLLIYVWFMSYMKCANRCQILKLLSNFGCLFTFWYSEGANSIKTDLRICICKLQVIDLVLILFPQEE